MEASRVITLWGSVNHLPLETLSIKEIQYVINDMPTWDS